MKRSIIAAMVALCSLSANAAKGNADIITNDGSNVVITIAGKDTSEKTYDLDQMDTNKTAIDDVATDLNNTKLGVLVVNDDLQASKQSLTSQVQAAQSAATAAQNTASANSQANSQSVSKLNNSFSALKNQVDSNSHDIQQNRKEANAGIAGAMAMAGTPQVQANQTFMISAGAATFNNENAVAVGASANVTEHVVTKFNVSADTQSNFGASVGVGYGF